MALRIEKKKVLDCLTALKLNVPVSDMSDTSKYTIFQQGRVHAFNDFTGMTLPFHADMEDCAVDAALLYEFVRGVPDKELLMGLQNGALRVVGANKVADGVISATFPLREDVYYPKELVAVDIEKYGVLPETFALSLTHTAFACDDESVSSSRVVFHGGFAYSRGKHAICEFYLGDEAAAMITDEISVSPAAVGFINRNNPRKYAAECGWLHLMNEDGWIYSSRMMADINFPFAAVRDMLEEPTSEVFRFPANIKDILLRCSPFSGFSAKIRKVDVGMRDGTMTLQATRSDGSAFLEKARVIDADAFIDISINLAAFTSVIELVDRYKTDGCRLLGYGPSFRVMVTLEAKE